jgi:NADPH:quinone reductase
MVIRGTAMSLEHREIRRPGAGEILVAVTACGVNNADIAQVAGRYPAPSDAPSDVPGLELSGIVSEVGHGVTRFHVGNRVMALVGGGGYADTAVFNERLAMPVPDNVSDASAAGFPEAFVTAHDALLTQCRLSLGERALIHGAAGGVGSAAVQLAVACGAEVVATVRSVDRWDDVASLGATVIDVADIHDYGPFDVIVELTSGANVPRNLAVLNDDGRLSIIGTGDHKTAEVNFGDLARRRGRIYASTLRARSLERRAEAVRAVERHVLPLLASERVRVPVFCRFPLEAAPDAHQRFREPGKFGKIILEIDAGGRDRSPTEPRSVD